MLQSNIFLNLSLSTVAEAEILIFKYILRKCDTAHRPWSTLSETLIQNWEDLGHQPDAL